MKSKLIDQIISQQPMVKLWFVREKYNANWQIFYRPPCGPMFDYC